MAYPANAEPSNTKMILIGIMGSIFTPTTVNLTWLPLFSNYIPEATHHQAVLMMDSNYGANDILSNFPNEKQVFNGPIRLNYALAGNNSTKFNQSFSPVLMLFINFLGIVLTIK